jgi:hypothetical protein
MEYASEEYMAIPKWDMPVRNIASHVLREKKTLRPGSVYFRNECREESALSRLAR